jgi:hypothetical protein
MVGGGEHTVLAGGALLDKRGVAVVDCSERASGADAAWAAGGSPQPGRGGPSTSSQKGVANLLKFGREVGCSSPQVRVPAAASGQGTVAVGSPNPRAMGGHMNSLRRAHPEVSSHATHSDGKRKACLFWSS